MVNKKAWLRIIEAVISILIVFGAVLTVTSINQQSSVGDICDELPPLLDEIAKTNSMRSAVLSDNKGAIEDFLGERIKNPAIIYEVKICSLNDNACGHSQSGSENIDVCADERVISASVSGPQLDSKKLKIFLFKSN